ncbi:hypothetical protein [Bacillus pumilus]|nr:hypothetical protein [Bacillus pumilus]
MKNEYKKGMAVTEAANKDTGVEAVFAYMVVEGMEGVGVGME